MFYDIILQNIKNNFRYENKFVTDLLIKEDIISFISNHPSLFHRVFDSRYVNSIYFDTYEMQSYHQNVHGLAERFKLRIRWYGEKNKAINPNIEIKLKSGHVGSKLIYPINNFLLEDIKANKNSLHLTRNTDLPAFLQNMFKFYSPVLLVRYRRSYFLSECKQFRLTVDSNLSFSNLNQFQKNNNASDSIIIELKYLRTVKEGAGKISLHFPFRVTRNSKYVIGVEKVYN